MIMASKPRSKVNTNLKGGADKILDSKRNRRMSVYPREKRLEAIKLYIKYQSATEVIHELGYPNSRNTLLRWYEVYLQEQKTGVVCERYSRRPKFSLEQKIAAVEYYLTHGRNKAKTVRALGYPCKETFRTWCKELAPETRKRSVSGIQYTREQKKECVIALCTRPGSAKDVAGEYGVTRQALYSWKNDLLGKGDSTALVAKEDKPLSDDRDALLSEVESLKSQIHRLKLEKAILEGTVDIVKKDPGVDLKRLTNKEKAILVGTLKNEYPLKDLLDYVKMSVWLLTPFTAAAFLKVNRMASRVM